MDRDDQLAELLERWEDAIAAGHPLTPDDLCGKTPELRHESTQILRDLGRVDPLLQSRIEITDSKGDLIDAGRFVPISFLDEGGLGFVYVAEDTELKRSVVLKWMKPLPAMDERSRNRFMNEAEITGKLEHPGVAPVYGAGRDPRVSPYYAMRLIEGKTLSDEIRKFHAEHKHEYQSGEFARLLRKFVAVCQTVAYAHARGVIHRDIKPGNMMIGPYGETLLVDWGLAKTYNLADPEGTVDPGFAPLRLDIISPDTSLDGEVKGSPAYMSPEQASGDTALIGPRSDIYSLGATLYVMLTGKSLYPGRNSAEVIHELKHRPPVINPDNEPLPKALLAICRKAMARMPGDRYENALHLADDVDRWLADEPVKVHRDGLVTRTRRWVKNHRTLVSSTLAMLLIGVVAMIVVIPILSGKNRELAQEIGLKEKANTLLAEESRATIEANEKLAKEIVAKESAFKQVEEEQKSKLAIEKQAVVAERQKSEALEEKNKIETAAKNEAERTAERLEDRLYFDRIQLAMREWEANHPDRVKAILEQCEPGKGKKDRRNWEWYYLRRLLDAGHVDIHGHIGFVPCVAFSRNGTQLASGDSRGKVKVTVWLDNQKTFFFDADEKHTGYVKCIAFSDEDKYLASGSEPIVGILGGSSEQGEIKIWKPGNLKKSLRTLPGSRNSVLAWRPKSSVMAYVAGDKIQLYDASNDKFTKTIGDHFSHIDKLAFSPDGRSLAIIGHTKNRGTLKIWEVESGKELLSIDANTLGSGLAWSPDGKQLITCGIFELGITILDAETGRKIQNLWGHRANVSALTYSPEGQTIVSADVDGVIKVWSAESGRELRTVRGAYPGPIWSMAFRPDGQRLAVSGVGGVIRLWDPFVEPERIVATSDCYHMAISTDGMQFAGGGQYSNSGVTVWGVRDEKTFNGIAIQPRYAMKQYTGTRSLAFGPNNRAASGGSIPDWDARDPKKPFDFPLKGQIQIWNTQTGVHERKLIDHKDEVNAIAFSPDGKWLVSGSTDKLVKVWRLSDGTNVATFDKHKGPIVALVFHKDGSLASASANEVFLWHPEKLEPRHTFSDLGFRVESVAFDSTGTRFAIAGMKEVGIARIWKMNDFQTWKTISGHTRGIRHVCFNADGIRLATAGNDHTVKIWDTETGHDQEILSLPANDNSALQHVAFTPDGLLIAGGAGQLNPGRYIVWNGTAKDVKPFDRPPTEADLNKSKRQRDLLQGEWKLVSYEEDGVKMSDKVLEGKTVIIKDDRYQLKSGEKVLREYTFRIDSRWLPGEFDILVDKSTSQGIYVLNDDDLKICLNIYKNMDRPVSLNASEGTRRTLFVLKRNPK